MRRDNKRQQGYEQMLVEMALRTVHRASVWTGCVRGVRGACAGRVAGRAQSSRRPSSAHRARVPRRAHERHLLPRLHREGDALQHGLAQVRGVAEHHLGGGRRSGPPQTTRCWVNGRPKQDVGSIAVAQNKTWGETGRDGPAASGAAGLRGCTHVAELDLALEAQRPELGREDAAHLHALPRAFRDVMMPTEDELNQSKRRGISAAAFGRARRSSCRAIGSQWVQTLGTATQ
eukprot:COSAG01_NODE_1328_length_10708_cov_102.064379_4_plen_232_part_00